VRARATRRLAAAIAVGALTQLVGCTPSEKRIAGWETSEDGPEELERVVTAPRAPLTRRASAALAMIRLTRRGRHVGTDLLLTALARLAPGERAKVLGELVPHLREQLSARRPSGEDVVDPSIAGKDFVVSVLARGLSPTEAVSEPLREALVTWTQTDTLARLSDDRQRTSVQQAMRVLGARGIAHVPDLLAERTEVVTLTALVAELGDAPTKAAAGVALAKLDAHLQTPAAREEWLRKIDAANTKNGYLHATLAQREGQLRTVLGRDRTAVLDAMVLLGEPRLLEIVLGRAADASAAPAARVAALEALRPIAKTLPSSVVAQLVAIARDDDHGDRDVRAAAVDRLVDAHAAPELLYGLFATRTWEVRFRAAKALLTAPSLDVAEWMRHLPVDDKLPMGILEPLVYGRTLARRPGGVALLAPYLSSRALGPKLVALGGFHGGPKASQAALAPFAADPTKLPRCSADGSCGWTCTPLSSGPRYATVGELVSSCILPTLGNAGARLPSFEPPW
jgi:hypothetical protein